MRTSLLCHHRLLLGLVLGFSLLVNCLFYGAKAQPIQEFDIVLIGGRVIDPETGLDDIRNIGISDGRITEISSESLNGKESIDVSGLTVSPGFIDLHVHGLGMEEQSYKIHDGVTSFFELEAGLPFLDEWHQSIAGKMLMNYGASTPWPYHRAAVMEEFKNDIAKFEAKVKQVGWQDAELRGSPFLPSNQVSLPVDRIPQMLDGLQSALEQGALGIGIPLGYVPEASREEVFRVYQFAGQQAVPIATHVRRGGEGIQQAIADAVLTEAPLHICHINSSSLKEIDLTVEMVQLAQKKGYDISMEMYPYTASSTEIKSAAFDTDWQTARGISYGELQWVDTGERLTEESFNKYRETGGVVIVHMMKPEWIQRGIAAEGMIVASDGMPYAPKAHPRTAGTYARVLGKYVREDKVITLPDAIRKMTLLPAQVLEKVAPTMRMKGRIQVGADADITVFDAETIIDRATFEEGLANSRGIHHVIVNGVFVLKNDELVPDVYPGQAVYGKYKK